MQPTRYRAIDQHGQVIDVLVTTRQDAVAARQFFARAMRVGPSPIEVTTDRAPVYPRIVEDLEPAAGSRDRSVRQQHGRSRPRPTEGKTAADARTETISSTQIITTGHAFVQNLRRGHYELTADTATRDPLGVAFDELARAI